MKKILLSGSFAFLTLSLAFGAGYKVGDKAEDFRLQNIDGKYVSLADFDDAKGFIVAFTCNGCPYAQAYQDRLIALDKKYKTKGYPVVAINPNDVDLKPEDSLGEMKQRAKEKGYTFPYLKDAEYEVFKAYGATRTPHIFLLQKERGDLIVKYIGAIDDNYQNASAVQEDYLSNAVEALLAGRNPSPNETKAIGCTIKYK
jgi:peroxiredoxin